MKKRNRRIAFYICAVIFVVLGYVTILYAQGYKYSFNDGKFLRTGAISLKANTDAKVFVQDVLEGTTSFLTDSFSKGRLLPGRYTVKLEKEDYSTWKKTVVVEEGKVTDFPRVLLLPQTEDKIPDVIAQIEEAFLADGIVLSSTPRPSPRTSVVPSPTPQVLPVTLVKGVLTLHHEGSDQILATKVSGFALAPSQRQLAWWNNNELWVMWLTDVDSHQPYHKAGDKDLITRFTAPIKRAAWFGGEDHIVVESNSSTLLTTGGYKIVEIDKRGGINIIKI